MVFKSKFKKNVVKIVFIISNISMKLQTKHAFKTMLLKTCLLIHAFKNMPLKTRF